MPKVQIEMEMPKDCNNCNFCIFDFQAVWGNYCAVNRKLLGLLEPNKRHKDCPLKEVK